ncbi:hypothetical protein Daura_12390 [Dactylosporangium aurantiacum]|uniref:Uncharacterized protein n=1 Tax=Dactylosporangium aurantiacum TaxID=35754 RepID=A0A9Q9IL71_9ACTN|nr:hypothetical protein [Dactylosporangium aurantiacum]MDG6104087.1 hypothetical protein [Dactylosporangium aurantiacum]UWZ56898.1 hypothetical protein Daura_12390 [Dactylosporangium aurantiacum]
MSEYGEIETGETHSGLAEAHAESGSEQDYSSQYGILEQDHQSIEHTEYENVRHIEYTDAAGNHYEVTEYTHYEHTEIESEHTFAAYGQEGSAGFGAAELGTSEAASDSHVLSLTERFESFLGNALDGTNYEISDSSA